ncbi:MAG: hypothetical protein HY665_10110 [Chloroflexi bacterium]|nr:hypothetical protein [Chloroflexota bacterium]
MKLILAGLVIAALVAGSYASSQRFDTKLRSIVRPQLFSIVGWEAREMAREFQRLVAGRPKADNETRRVIEHFSASKKVRELKSEVEAAIATNRGAEAASLEAELGKLEKQRAASAEVVERIIEKQIRETLAEQGIYNPLVNLRFGFPPVNFKLQEPPYLLVVSPRDRIESIRTLTLKSGMAVSKMEAIEGEVDKLNVSSLVVGLSGLGATYPTIVTDEYSLRNTLDAASEEWVHQYLTFKPLGFRYVLSLTGISRNYEIGRMNETVAGMVAKEIASMVYQKYYAASEEVAGPKETGEPKFDFNREMRDIRKAVDLYLSRGEVEKAEQFMKDKQQYLALQGYHIRKLNQAYFAFHGAYGDSPTSIDPIGVEMKELRRQSASLKDFLNTAAGMTSRQDLIGTIKEKAASR